MERKQGTWEQSGKEEGENDRFCIITNGTAHEQAMKFAKSNESRRTGRLYLQRRQELV